MAKGNILLLAVCCLCLGENRSARSTEGNSSPELADMVGEAIWNCMSGKLTQAIDVSSGANNCWYSERYRSCLSANLSAGPASQVVDFNNVVYPQDCVAQQVTTNKCVSSAMSEVNKYGCEVKVKDILKSVNFSDMREAYCRASVTAHDCILSVVKYCSVTEGPQIIDNLSTFSRVRSECLSHLPVTTTTTVEKSDIGGIGDLFPTSDFAISDNGTGTSNNTPPLQAGAAAVSGLVLLLFLNF